MNNFNPGSNHTGHTQAPNSNPHFKRNKKRMIKKVCLLCKKGEFYIDYKNVTLLKKYLKNNNKISARKSTGNCQAHQRRISNAIKRARIVALLPFVPE